MTAAQTVQAFKNNIDQFSTARANDIDYWINEGIEAFVKDRLSPDKGNTQGFQANQRARDELDEIVKFNVTGVYSNGVLEYPALAYEIIANSIRCQTTEQASKQPAHITARARSWDWYNSYQTDPFVKPLYKKGRLAYIESDDGIYIFPNLDYDEVLLSYIKNWTPFNLDNDDPIPLKAKTHSEIARWAAAKYLFSIGNNDGAKTLLMQNAFE